MSVDFPTPPLPLAIASTRVLRSSAMPFERSVTSPRSRVVNAARSSGVITSNSSATRSTPSIGASTSSTCCWKLSRSGHPAIVSAIVTTTSPPSISHVAHHVELGHGTPQLGIDHSPERAHDLFP